MSQRGALPLEHRLDVVAYAGKLSSDPNFRPQFHAYLPADLRKMMDEAWAASYRRLAALSTRSRIVNVAHSSHIMYMDRPDAIIDAARDMLEDVRRGDRRK